MTTYSRSFTSTELNVMQLEPLLPRFPLIRSSWQVPTKSVLVENKATKVPPGAVGLEMLCPTASRPEAGHARGTVCLDNEKMHIEVLTYSFFAEGRWRENLVYPFHQLVQSNNQCETIVTSTIALKTAL